MLENSANYFNLYDIEEVKCNLCGTFNSEILEDCIVTIDSYSFSFKMVKCPICGLVYLNPRLNESGLKAFYEAYFKKPKGGDYDIEQINSSPHLMDRFLGEIEKRIAKGKLLDVGCGRGSFLNRAKERGWYGWGVEFSEIAALEARELGLNVQIGDLTQVKFPSSYFDVVTLFNVIEHVRDPFATISEVHRVLKHTGLLVIRAPNIDWLEFPPVGVLRNIKKRVKGFLDKNYYFSTTGILNMFMVQHLYYFSRETLRLLLEKIGFKIEWITTRDPWHFQTSLKALKRREYFQSAYFLCMAILSMTDQGSTVVIYARKDKRYSNYDLKCSR